MKLEPLLPACFALVAVFAASASQAATFCVTNTAELQAALAQAESNGQDDEIRLAAGNYASSSGFSYSSAEPHDLGLRGDWSPTCTVRSAQAQFSTVTVPPSPGGGARVLDIEAGDGAVLIEALLIFNGNPEDLTRGGGLRVRTAGGDITLDRNNILSNFAASNGGVYARSGGGDIRARNNIVATNSQLAGASIELVALDGDIFVSGNTVLRNLTQAENSGSAGLSVSVNALDPNRRAYLSNNLLRDNTDWGNLDLEAFGANHRYYNAVVDERTGGDAPQVIVGEISEDPRVCLPEIDQIQPCGRMYTPLSTSPLLDAGANSPFGGGLSLDVFGEPRIAGGIVDIGAIENGIVVFADGFE